MISSKTSGEKLKEILREHQGKNMAICLKTRMGYLCFLEGHIFGKLVTRQQMQGGLQQKEMNYRIGPKVKHAQNFGMDYLRAFAIPSKHNSLPLRLIRDFISFYYRAPRAFGKSTYLGMFLDITLQLPWTVVKARCLNLIRDLQF